MNMTDALLAARSCILQDRMAFADCNVRDDGSFEEFDAEALAEYDAVLAQIDEALREDAMQRLADIGQAMGGYDVPSPRYKPLSDADLRTCFCETNTSEPLAEGWPGLERFARAVEREVLRRLNVRWK